ncbi:hypothetical protein F0231_07985 [Vibrio sp. RE86]|uniref:hypothetical protein n=1 Tax=Vibrio sp. RE86 TaxID=2607605 RepID=UPI0014934C66|nr:hypothetical protein [Vibrio sp. RE86]NOH79683.1 hypothetical protein [Vibrio sp. RE86]
MKQYLLLLILFSSSFAWSFEQPAVDLMTTPTLLLSQGRYAQASSAFHTQANKALVLEKSIGREEMWRAAGLLEAIAAMSAEKQSDPAAYEYWANSVRYFLMGGTTWEELKRSIRQDYEQVSSIIGVNIVPGDSGFTVDDATLQFYSFVEIWDTKLQFFLYNAPKSGLINQAQTNLAAPSTESNSTTGQQLKQYSPNSKLMIGNNFSEKQSFVVAPSEVEMTQQGDEAQSVSESDVEQRIETTVATPIDAPILIEEVEKEEKAKETLNAPQQQISRGNADADITKPVQATQRRSFAPVTEN